MLNFKDATYLSSAAMLLAYKKIDEFDNIRSRVKPEVRKILDAMLDAHEGVWSEKHAENDWATAVDLKTWADKRLAAYRRARRVRR